MESVARFYRFSAAIVAAAMLAACSGGANSGIGSSSVTPSTQAGNATGVASATAMRATLAAHKKKQQGKARITIKIPLKKLTLRPLPFDKHHVHPKYISASTESMTVAVAGMPTQTFNLTPTSPGCSTISGNVTCSETAFFPTGQQTITVTLYDQQNGAGNQLSTASTSVTIATGAVTNVSITLDGVVATAKVLLNGSASDSIPEGTATSVPVSVTAYDADNNIIMTPGSYSSPVTLRNSDSSRATTLSTSSVSVPGAAITLIYNGAALSSTTITPSVGRSAQPSGAATLTLTPPATPTPPAITEYTIPTSGSQPWGITTGPNGALWFTEYGGNQVGQITTGGTFTEYSIPTSSSQPYGISAGPDGALWFTEFSGNKIGRSTTSGAIAEYSIPTANSNAEYITVGPDGMLWFTEHNGPGGLDLIGRITTGGAFSAFPILNTRSAAPSGITVGPDGAVWFTESSGNKIGQITTSGEITEYAIPTSGSIPTGVTAGSDGALWFTEHTGNKIGRITTGGAITEYTIPTSGSDPIGITAGPDGALWFVECGGPGKIGRITTDGAITEYPTPTSGSQPKNITTGPDGALWFTEAGSNEIGRIPTNISPNARKAVR